MGAWLQGGRHSALPTWQHTMLYAACRADRSSLYCTPGPTRRFGNSYSALEEAAAVACEMGPRQPAAKEATLKAAVTTLGLVSC